MFIVEDARLVVLEVPKTATQSLRQALKQYAKDIPGVRRHGGYEAFERDVRPMIAEQWGDNVECSCVVREPLARMRSWYRYRQRDKVAGTDRSTLGMSFDDYIEALLSDSPPPFVQSGRQARFTGWNGSAAKVDHVFAYERMQAYLDFLGSRLEFSLTLPTRNQSSAPMPAELSPELLAQFKKAYADDYGLYESVLAADGHLRRN